MHNRARLAIAVLFLLLLPGEVARAHEGPPFPIVNDHRIGNMIVSVWTDPDIGTGKFFVIVEMPEGVAVPDDLTIDVGVAPVSGRLEEVLYRAEPQKVRHGARHYAEVQFDQGEFWNVRVLVRSSAGSDVITSQVEATPDGSIGPMGMVVYLIPFLAVGFLWLKAAMRKRKAA